MLEMKKAPITEAEEEQHKDTHLSEILQNMQAVKYAPTNISPDALEPLELPIDGLSEKFQRIAMEYSEGLQANRDYVLASMFAAVGSALGKRIQLNWGEYDNYPSLWFAIVGDSGMNKSTPMAKMLKPLRERQNALYKDYRKALLNYDAAVKGGDKEAERPIYNQLIMGDSTPEALLQVLSRLEHVLMFNDELSTFFGNIGRYTKKSGESSQMISIWSGQDVEINRKSEPELHISEPALSILGSIQPRLVAEYFGGKTFVDSGFTYRWLFVFPDPTPEPPYHKPIIPNATKEAWHNFVDSLLDKPLSVPRLVLDNDAEEIYIEYMNSHKQPNLTEFQSEAYKKFNIMVLRWAIIAHLMGNHPETSRIHGDEMEYSVKCMRYFEKCAWKVYDTFSTPARKKQRPCIPMKKEVLAALQVYYPTLNKSMCAESLGIAHTNFAKEEIKEQVAEYKKMLEH